MDLRKQFITELIILAKKDKKAMLLTGDLGYSIVEPFQKLFPDRFINVGCIEQSMIGIAAGLAIAGWKPFVYSTINFLLFRPLEQVRNDVCYNNTNVKLIGARVSPFLGFSHNISENEDVNILNNFPNIKISLPENNKQIKKAISGFGPLYMRL